MLIPFIQYPHGTIKWFLESSQGLLLRLPSLQILLVVVFTLLMVSLWTKRVAWQIALWISICIVMYITPHYGLMEMMGTSLLLLFRFISFDSISVIWQNRLSTVWIKWSPLCWLASPQLMVRVHSFRPFVALLKVGQVLFPLTLLLSWQWFDVLRHYEYVRKDMEQWPIERLDADIVELAHSPPNVRADWHGVRIMGTKAIVTCEQRPRLMAFDLLTTERIETPLHPRWGPENVGPLESEINTNSNLVWTVNGGTHILESKLNGAQWQRYREVKLPTRLSFSYITRAIDRLYMIEVQTGGNEGSRKLLTAPLPSLRPITELNLTMNGNKAPMPREPLWVPSINQLIYGSEFGEQLFAIDMDDGTVRPWLKAQTFNGKMAWSDGTERVYSAVPNKMQIQVIDPTVPKIDYTIWTQPGVRALAVDGIRGLLVSASVLTGQIWVQDVHTGAVVKRMGTVYPMVREIALSEELGIGVLTTWNAVYQFTYVD